MKVQVNITTATTIRMDVPWPQAPYPAIGDAVLFRRGDLVWGFRVKDRHIGVGTDPRTGEALMQIGLQVDTEAPAEWGE